MKPLKIGDLIAKVPIIQGGMGVGVSLGGLAGAVAKEGAVGVISTAQIGYRDPDFHKHPAKSNLEAIETEIKKAKEISGGGIVGVNIMVALKHFKEHVQASIKAGADLIISGAGIPMDLPALVQGSNIKIAPIVSTKRCANIILNKWFRSYKRLPDLVVIEGPKAGGHLGFSKEEAVDYPNYEEEVKDIISFVNDFSKEHEAQIPVVVAGGIFDRSDIDKALSLGASGVQMASRFVATHECDASMEYKQAYINATHDDVTIVSSPVGLPGRCINNKFVQMVTENGCKVTRCDQCLAKCNPAKIPYCITNALIQAVKGNIDEGLLFCGDNVGKIKEIISVKQLINELCMEG